ncbi:EamA family transporter [Arcanobacterium haemolyticum]|nr:EamA family transporter [Arcanobacterium haemolyticum]
MPAGQRLAPALVIASGLTQYAGAALAVGLFATIPALSVAWGRIFCGAVILAVWRRHILRREDGRIDWRGLRITALFGLILGGMNLCFYVAINHIPLGTAVALEYVGPVVLAAFTGRGWKVWSGIVLACGGVFLISWAGVDLHAPGVAFGVVMAFVAGGLWALYIVVGRGLATGGRSMDSLMWAMVIAAVIYVPFSFPVIHAAATNWHVLATMLAVGVMSSVVPYAVDQVVMRLMPPASFALLGSLFPATSLLLGVLMLGQIPNHAEVIGLIAVSVAVLLATLPEGHHTNPEPSTA